jgi:glycosyltransferase involved in cell wall biosynthesis
MALVSICIPTYNRKDYLKETLESVFAQTYKDHEIVIVDDGSTDGTGEMIRQIDLPIRYYWQENAGDAAARNKLIELAQAKYITFIDSDDLLMPNALEQMMEVISREKEDVVIYGTYLRIDQNGNIYGRCRRRLHSGYVTKYLFQDIFIHSCGSMFPKHILDADTAFDTTLKVCSDYDLWLRLSMRYEFVALADPVFKRRRHSSNLSARSFKSRLTELNVLERFYYEKGGDRVIPRRLAMRRLSKEAYRVGKSALAEGNLKAVQKYFEKSLQYSFNLKSMFFLKRNKWTC